MRISLQLNEEIAPLIVKLITIGLSGVSVTTETHKRSHSSSKGTNKTSDAAKTKSASKQPGILFLHALSHTHTCTRARTHTHTHTTHHTPHTTQTTRTRFSCCYCSSEPVLGCLCTTEMFRVLAQPPEVVLVTCGNPKSYLKSSI